jgi:hypothetical protein
MMATAKDNHPFHISCAIIGDLQQKAFPVATSSSMLIVDLFEAIREKDKLIYTDQSWAPDPIALLLYKVDLSKEDLVKIGLPIGEPLTNPAIEVREYWPVPRLRNRHNKPRTTTARSSN